MATNRPKVKPISRMLEDPNREIHKTYGTTGVLSKLWRITLKDLNINGYRFSMLMEQFLNDPKNLVPDNPKERFNNRGNLNKEMSNTAMSWKVFCKCLRFLKVVEFRVTLELKHRDNKTTIHQVQCSLDDTSRDVPLFEDELPENQGGPLTKVPEDQEQIAYLDNEEEY